MAVSLTGLLNARPGCAQRPPDWRWELARARREYARDPRTLGLLAVDEYVGLAEELQAAADLSSPDPDRLAFLLTAAEAAEAYAFRVGTLAAESAPGEDGQFYGPLTAMAMSRAELEALVLAGKSPKTISKVCGLSEAAAGWYERFWFDVRDRLGRPGWVAANAIGDLHQPGTPAALLPALVRAYGYYTKSARVVRAVVSTFDAPAARRAAKDPGRFFAADAAQSGALKAALATRVWGIHPKSVARIVELHHEALDIEAKFSNLGGSDAEAKYRDAAARVLGTIELAYGAEPDDDAPSLPRLVSAQEAG